MSISKVKQVRLETTAEYQPISDLNVRFFNQDINTSVFDFIVTRKNHPIPLGVDNVEGSIVLKSDKFKIQDEVQIKDGLNGIVTYTLPKAILERPGKVTGQIYIGVKGKEDTVVQRLFSFNIEDSLINSFDAETKLVYIRKFDQLEEQISQRVESIEQAIEHSEDYVTKIVEEKDIALNQIDESKINILEKIEEEKDNLHSIGKTYKENFEQVDEELNQKIEDIKETVKPETYVKHNDTENWQKYKLTESNGTTPLMSDFDFNSPESVLNYSAGTYYVRGALNSTANNIVSNYGYLSINTTYSTKSIATLTFIPIGTNTLNNTSVYMRKKNGDWGDWKEITNNQYDTGWLTFDLINGAKTNTAYPTRNGFESAYRIIKNGDITEKYLRINGSNVDHTQVIAQLPSTFVKNVHIGFIRTPLAHNGSSIIIETTGEVRIYIENYDSWENSESKYIYGEVSWVD